METEGLESIHAHTESVCLVAIIKDEEPFLDEWILYHKMMGIDHFILYDDHPAFPLESFLYRHSEYVTVINWACREGTSSLLSNQIRAYRNAAEFHIAPYDWVLFLDADEFVLIRERISIQEFLKDFAEASAVSLHWHLFGHNGYYNDPEQLVTSSLTRRMKEHPKTCKTFTRTKKIRGIESAHFCLTDDQLRVDANNSIHVKATYRGQTDIANINHYHCRSFTRWMKRAERGDAYFNPDNLIPGHDWRLTSEGCLKQFVTTVALHYNELQDRFMMRYQKTLNERLENLHLDAARRIKHPDAQADKIRSQLKKIANCRFAGAGPGPGPTINDRLLTVLFFFHYSRYSGREGFRRRGIGILDEIAGSIHAETPFTLNNGLASIGLVVEYLVLNGLFVVDTDDLLEDIDALTLYYLENQLGASANATVTGISAYLLARAKNSVNDPDLPIREINLESLKVFSRMIPPETAGPKDPLLSIDLLLDLYELGIERERTRENIDDIVTSFSGFRPGTVMIAAMAVRLYRAAKLLDAPPYAEIARNLLDRQVSEPEQPVSLEDLSVQYAVFSKSYCLSGIEYFKTRAAQCLEGIMSDADRLLGGDTVAGVKTDDERALAAAGLGLLAAIDPNESSWQDIVYFL